MLDWIIGNTATIVITAILILIVICIIRKLIKDKKRGISCCGGNCSHCRLNGSCHHSQK